MQKCLDKNPQKYGQNVLFGQIVTLGIKSLGQMSSWANCHIGHKVVGQNVTLGNMALGIFKTWAFCHLTLNGLFHREPHLHFFCIFLREPKGT